MTPSIIPPDWTLRPASDDDVEQMAALIAIAFADVARQFGLDRENCPSHPAFITAETIRHRRERGGRFIMAVSPEKTLGCIGVRPPKDATCLLEKLAVDPAWRHRGLGRALVAEAMTLARAAGARHVRLGIIDGHHALQSWYQALGFSVTGTARFDSLPFRVLYMQQEIASPYSASP
ncbi:MAG: GNAT family N-acetyltransferase [Azospirillaceae bacterium]|nr:GNAT family N-acetyltransferase [Azospirillaceae bacterium]